MAFSLSPTSPRLPSRIRTARSLLWLRLLPSRAFALVSVLWLRLLIWCNEGWVIDYGAALKRNGLPESEQLKATRAQTEELRVRLAIAEGKL